MSQSQISNKQVKINNHWTADGTAQYQIKNIADPTAPQDVATKAYADGVSAAINVHEATNTATVSDILSLGTGGAYAATPNNGTFTWTTMPTSIDGVNLSVGIRVLVKNQADAKQNGIYVVNSSTTMTRAADADGTPFASEVTAGDLSFNIGGLTSTQKGTSWVLLGSGIQTLNTNDLNYTMFGSSTTYTAGNGVTLNLNSFELDIIGLTANTSTGNDTIAFYDVSLGTNSKTTIGNLISDNNIVTSIANGIITQTATGVYANRKITGTSGVITVTDGNGVSGNPAIDIASTWVGQTSITTLGIITTGTWNATTIAVNHGGTGATSLTANGILIGNGTSAITSTVLTDGQLLIGKTGNAPVAANITGVTNEIVVTNGAGTIQLGISPNYDGGTAIVTVGTITSGTWNGTTIAATAGGTGHAVYAVGDILYADTTTSLARLAAGTDGFVLTLSGGVPIWSAAAGDITSVSAGAGLTGGGTSGAITLDIVAAASGAITVNANDIAVNVDGVTINVNGSNNLAIKSGGITANLLSASLTHTPLGNGTDGQLLTATGAGTFKWTDPSPAPTQYIVDSAFEAATDINNLNGGGIVTIATIITSPFGTNTPIASPRVAAFVNGLKTKIGLTTSDPLYFSTDGGTTAVASYGSLAGADLIFNAAAAGYDCALTDNIELEYYTA